MEHSTDQFYHTFKPKKNLSRWLQALQLTCDTPCKAWHLFAQNMMEWNGILFMRGPFPYASLHTKPPYFEHVARSGCRKRFSAQAGWNFGSQGEELRTFDIRKSWQIPIGCMYGICFTFFYHKFRWKVGKYSLHGASGKWAVFKIRLWFVVWIS